MSEPYADGIFLVGETDHGGLRHPLPSRDVSVLLSDHVNRLITYASALGLKWYIEPKDEA